MEVGETYYHQLATVMVGVPAHLWVDVFSPSERGRPSRVLNVNVTSQ